MKIATFNINNVNERLPNLMAWLRCAGFVIETEEQADKNTVLQAHQ
jgi:exonuclease III